MISGNGSSNLNICADRDFELGQNSLYLQIPLGRISHWLQDHLWSQPTHLLYTFISHQSVKSINMFSQVTSKMSLISDIKLNLMHPTFIDHSWDDSPVLNLADFSWFWKTVDIKSLHKTIKIVGFCYAKKNETKINHATRLL